MNYEWKQTIFTPEDFSGSGQYIVRETINKENREWVFDTGYLSTVMFKVGYIHGGRDLKRDNLSCLISMSDGMIKTGYFITVDENGKQIEDSVNWKWVSFTETTVEGAKSMLCEYLNNNPYGETFRFATNEEVVRVALYQKSRTRK